MTRDKADSKFSEYIRTRDNWTCQRCLRKYKEKSQGLHCSHFFGRRNESVRFDPENCVSLCFGCHKYFDEHDREAYREFKIKQLGEKQFELLTIKARTPKKKDRKMSYIIAQQLLNDLKNNVDTNGQ